MTSETSPVETPPVVNTRIFAVGKRAVMRVEWTGLNAKSECTVTLHALWDSENELKPKAFPVGFDQPTMVDLSKWEPNEGQRTARFQLRLTPEAGHLAALSANVPLDRSDFFRGVVGYIDHHHAPSPKPPVNPNRPPQSPPQGGGIPWSLLPPSGSETDDLGED